MKPSQPFTLFLALLASLTLARADDLVLASNGLSRSVILADAAVMASDRSGGRMPFREAEAIHQRQRLRESILDLA